MSHYIQRLFCYNGVEDVNDLIKYFVFHLKVTQQSPALMQLLQAITPHTDRFYLIYHSTAQLHMSIDAFHVYVARLCCPPREGLVG